MVKVIELSLNLRAFVEIFRSIHSLKIVEEPLYQIHGTSKLIFPIKT